MITLLTDFGLTDAYVGIMKGVILSRAPEARIVDLSHGIAPHDILSAGRCLAAAVPFFPAGTIHVAVVDPGVGTRRRVLFCKALGQYFLAPDNGLLSVVFDAADLEMAREVACEGQFLRPVSATFHGRDIFAPVAAALHGGMPHAQVGPEIAPDRLVRLPARSVALDLRKGVLLGRVCGNDHFGNLSTSIHHTDFDGACPVSMETVRVSVGGTVCAMGRTYGDVGAGELIALFGSSGLLEIAVNQGSAAQRLGVAPGEVVEIRWPVSGSV